MPVLEQSTYIPPFFFRNCHIHTMYPSLFRNVRDVNFIRERLELPDGDFLDLDWSCVGSDKIILAVHGLEGSSRSGYIPGMIKAFNRRGWDGVAMNLRGCSGELNRLVRFYHAGATDDVDMVVWHVLNRKHYAQLVLIGFSIGGNITLKYVGERGATLPQALIGSAALSTPCDLESCAWKLSEPSNYIYLQNFLRAFHRKIKAKMAVMPDKIHDKNFGEIKTLKEYDDRYTAPIHGFIDAKDYWTRCSCKQFLPGIRIPTLLVNALDDPFLTAESYPYQEARQNPFLFLETPSFGGHVGFIASDSMHEYWHETRVTSFLLTV